MSDLVKKSSDELLETLLGTAKQIESIHYILYGREGDKDAQIAALMNIAVAAKAFKKADGTNYPELFHDMADQIKTYEDRYGEIGGGG